MNGAIFFVSKYGSTAQYARWIGEATHLPVFDVDETKADPADYDLLILVSPVFYFKVLMRKWITRNLTAIERKTIIMVTVSGAPAGAKLDKWISDSLPRQIVSRMVHFALRGRQDPRKVSWFDHVMLRIGAMFNPDAEARKHEVKGFDFMDKSAIDPIVAMATDLLSREAP